MEQIGQPTGCWLCLFCPDEFFSHSIWIFTFVILYRRSMFQSKIELTHYQRATSKFPISMELFPIVRRSWRSILKTSRLLFEGPRPSRVSNATDLHCRTPRLFSRCSTIKLESRTMTFATWCSIDCNEPSTNSRRWTRRNNTTKLLTNCNETLFMQQWATLKVTKNWYKLLLLLILL